MTAVSDLQTGIEAYLRGELDRRALYRAVELHRPAALLADDADPLHHLFWRTLSLLDERGYGHRTDSELNEALRKLLESTRHRRVQTVRASSAPAA